MLNERIKTEMPYRGHLKTGDISIGKILFISRPQWNFIELTKNTRYSWFKIKLISNINFRFNYRIFPGSFWNKCIWLSCQSINVEYCKFDWSNVAQSSITSARNTYMQFSKSNGTSQKLISLYGVYKVLPTILNKWIWNILVHQH